MDGLPQRPEADASLPSPQRLDEERVLSKKPKHARRSLAPSAAASSSSSSTMVHPSAADRKRKQAAISASSEDGAAKRVRIAATDRDLVVTGTAQPSRYDMSQHVLAEVWQHIFSFVPPRSLGNLMCVNRLFHRYLDPASTFKVSAPDSDLPSSLPKQSPNTIWRASRRFHWPSMPSPLSGRSELDMWRLACSRSCQFCGCRADETDYAGDPLRWSRGPGNDTVSPVFQFFVASCGQCLAKNSIKEVDLLLSPSKPSFIAAGAPTVFVTADLNVVTRQIMRNSPIPTGVQLTKVFWPAQLESLQAELGDAKRFGTAAVEEWVKGLDSRGAKANRDASRWDNWYLSGGVRQMRKQSSSTQIIPSSDDRQRDKAERGGKIAAPKKQATHKYPTRSKAAGIQAAQSQGQDHTDSTTRADLSKLADKVINGQWDGGGSITGRNLATFVTQVLTCVRDQYHADSAKNNASSMRRLTLDDLRWIFTQKIAPLAKRPGVEVFSCNKCPTSKRYSLPSVIQHYCHKHSGKEANMSVHWKEEWTAELPFKPAPGAERQSLNNTNKGGYQAIKSRAAILAEDLAPAWRALTSVRNIPTPVKVSAAINFIARRHQEIYKQPAPWELLYIGKCPHIIGVEACLACKVCKEKSPMGTNKTFKLSGLAHHFHQTHEHVDWRTGMIWVPDLSQDIRDAIRKNKRAFELVSNALPWLFEDKEGMDQGDVVLFQSQQPLLHANQGTKDAVTEPATRFYPTEEPGESLHLVPASAVYSPPDAAHRELAYRTNISSNPHIEETGFRVHEAPARMSAQISAREIEARGGGTWETAHVRSRTVDSRHAVPESRSHVETYYVHREHEPHTREPPISYPYYPHMERQRQQAHAALEVRHASRQPWTTSYYNPPMSSAAAYHYAEPTRSHDRYGVVDVRNLPHEQYIERPVIYYGQRATPMPTISTIPAGSRIDTAPASRVYSEYPSRYQLVERVSRELELDIE
ncbi:uncharacterized protein TRIREDRAFT_104741 [Trichoderma reesei QM6a]|uniref:Predicted protein n=1 Tax=Hypocrea jecorina (strain QM6a) TaxID=431241 RepID=G0RDN6_HYPJQ|nr:uncharacterized protein TRIREDRAFT_104741 [Trichoderma reesei QM6a]EGR50586.1 predicted protein [Trichoderma reesei QM6a]